ncbi:MAG TPA: hypothetical protein PKD49_02880 [Hyphomicrobium sp.]|nr:hypothetical protein [Hyphomicrobium sp.]
MQISGPFQPGPLFSTKGVAELILEDCEDLGSCCQMVRNLTQRGLIEVRDVVGHGRTAHRQFALADVLAAKVLRQLTLHGIADNAALKAAHAALYKWTKDDHEAGRVTGEHPVSAALANFKKGEEWILHLSSYSRDGDRRYIASFFCPDTDFAPRIKGKRGCTSIVETREFILLKISILMWPDA